jgi:hypothetical protein
MRCPKQQRIYWTKPYLQLSYFSIHTFLHRRIPGIEIIGDLRMG